MKGSINILEGKTVGSYIFVGNRTKIENDLIELYNNKFRVQTFSLQSFDIDTVREIKGEHSLKSATVRLFILSFFSISVPAQNALLKLIEEPNQNTIFCIVVSDSEKLIKTVISRARVVVLDERENSTDKNVDLFLKTEPSLRLELSFVKKLLDSKQKDDTVDKEKIAIFLEKILLEFDRLFDKSKATIKELENIIRALKIYNTGHHSGTSIKMIFEYISLTLPKV